MLFVGKLIPLHGLETILAAAALCPDIEFRVVGSGQLDDVLVTKPENVRHERWAEYERLPDLYRSAGCALGIFGASAKAARVIPNKAFQALATQTPLITADTPAARELLEDGRDALLVPPADPEALALAVRRLASDPMLGAEIAARGHATYAENASEDVLGRRWRDLIERLISAHRDRSSRNREVTEAAAFDADEEPVDRQRGSEQALGEPVLTPVGRKAGGSLVVDRPVVEGGHRESPRSDSLEYETGIFDRARQRGARVATNVARPPVARTEPRRMGGNREHKDAAGSEHSTCFRKGRALGFDVLQHLTGDDPVERVVGQR